MKKRLQGILFPVLGMLLLIAGIGCKKNKSEVQAPVFTIESYYPNSGKGGTLITVEGTGFVAGPSKYTATIGGVATDVLSASATKIVVRAPLTATTGALVLKYGDKSFEAGNFTYQDLTIREISPANGPAGSTISVMGEGFAGLSGPASVFINGKASIVVSASDTLLVVEVPANAGSGPVTVKVDDMEAGGQPFKFLSLDDFKPKTGGKNTRVVITGSGFEPLASGNVVEFNGKAAVISEATETQLVATVPEGVTTGPLSVIINGQRITGAAFTVVAPPAITTVTPLSGPGGTLMTITGVRFSALKDENKVFINNVEAIVTAATDRELKVTIPGNTGDGKIRVVVNDQEAIGPDFKDQALGIQMVQPESGLEGTTVTITGTGFSTVAGDNKVDFNGTPAVITSATDTKLVLQVPAGFTTGPLVVTVGGVKATAPKVFRRSGIMTLAGGPNSTVLPSSISRIVVDGQKNLYVSAATRIYKITAGGAVSLFAGSPTGEDGTADGTGTDARFWNITGMDIDQDGNLYVMDNGLRKITASGVVTTVSSAFTGSNLCYAPDGSLYATRLYNGMWKYAPNGVVSRLVNLGVNDVCRPTVDNAGNLYYSTEEYQAIIQYFSPQTNTTQTLVGRYNDYGYVDGPLATTGKLNYGITSMVMDRTNNCIYILDPNNYAIRKADLNTRELSTEFKGIGFGYQDGSPDIAKFGFGVKDLAMDKDGDFYIIDQNNKAIRKVFVK